jgi:hypothetical protein
MSYSQDLEKDMVKVERQQQRWGTNNGDELKYCVFLFQEDTRLESISVALRCNWSNTPMESSL